MNDLLTSMLDLRDEIRHRLHEEHGPSAARAELHTLVGQMNDLIDDYDRRAHLDPSAAHPRGERGNG